MKRAWIVMVGVAAAVYLATRKRAPGYRPDEDVWEDPETARVAVAQFLSTIPNPPDDEEQRVMSFFPEIDHARRTFRIQAPLIAAVIAVESRGYPSAHGSQGEYGLMQILYPTAQMLGYPGPPEGLYHPGANIQYGTKYLRYQWDRYGDKPLPHQWVIAAYNTGTAYRSNGGFVNQSHVDRVMSRLDRYTYLVNQVYGAFGYRPSLSGLPMRRCIAC